VSDTELRFSALVLGLLSGAIFFGGLWWTVRIGMAARTPAAWFSVSLMFRTCLIVAGFYYVAAYGLQAVLLCMCGFLIARAAVNRLVQAPSRTAHAP
jgi:F1F0 ATPase subunit 2